MSVRPAVFRRLLLGCAALAACAPAAAEDLRLNPGAQPQDIAAVAEDLSAAYSYKALGPAEAFGVIGTGIGAYASYAGTDDEDAWQRATGSRNDSLGAVGLRARKGLPGGVDVSAFYAELPESDGRQFGGAAQVALLEGSTLTPGVALRAGYSRLDGVDDFGFDAWSLDATVSKGFAMLTPYAGLGYVRGELDPKDPTLSRERSEGARAFAGLRISLGLIDVTPEVERSGSNTVANLRLGVTL